MFKYLLWALSLNDVPPILRLLLIYMSDRGAWLYDEPVAHDVASAVISVKKAADWIGCDQTEVIAQADTLRDLGFRPMEVRPATISFNFPELPDADQTVPTKTESIISIYVIGIGPEISKIGISKFPKNRLANLQSANPISELTLAFTASGLKSRIFEAETRAHAALADRAIGNEWFRVDQSRAIAVVRSILKEMGILP